MTDIFIILLYHYSLSWTFNIRNYMKQKEMNRFKYVYSCHIFDGEMNRENAFYGQMNYRFIMLHV